MMDKPEYILCSANHYDDGIERIHQPTNIKTGIVVCGRRHHNIIYNYCKLTGSKIGDNCEQGFITNTDRFVDRKEAGEIAFGAGQTKTLISRLHSEDLY